MFVYRSIPDDVHVHDFRRTCGTVAASLGYNDFEVGLCLNHKTARGKVTSIYNRFQYLPEKKRLIARPRTCDDANFCFRSLALDITGCSVKADARGMDIGITTVGPINEARHRVQQGLA